MVINYLQIKLSSLGTVENVRMTLNDTEKRNKHLIIETKSRLYKTKIKSGQDSGNKDRHQIIGGNRNENKR